MLSLQPQPEEETEEPKMSIVDLKEKVKDLEKKREGDERKLVEKKLLQLSVWVQTQTSVYQTNLSKIIF